MTTKMTLAALALAALAAAPALAQDAPTPAPAPAPEPASESERAGPPAMAPHWFGGPMSAEERSALMQQRFAAADTNGDGQISSEEMVAAVEAAIAAERLARIEQMFARLDADGNGTLSLEEMEAARPGQMFGDRGQRGRDGHGHGRGGDRDGRS